MGWLLLAGFIVVAWIYARSVDREINATRSRAEEINDGLARRCSELEAEVQDLRRQVDYLTRRADN